MREVRNMMKYIVKKFYPERVRAEAWQIMGFVYAKNNNEAWEKAIRLYGEKNLEQVIPVGDWLD